MLRLHNETGSLVNILHVIQHILQAWIKDVKRT